MSQAVSPSTLKDLQALVGVPIGPTEWVEVTQDEIDRFAEATRDWQWIHVDAERAANGPFGTTVAHGLYSLALAPGMSGTLIDHSGFAHSLNYGYDRIRFPAPVPVGSRLRMHLVILAAEAVDGGIQMRSRQTIEREGSTKPVLVAENLARVIPGPAREDT